MIVLSGLHLFPGILETQAVPELGHENVLLTGLLRSLSVAAHPPAAGSRSAPISRSEQSEPRPLERLSRHAPIARGSGAL